MSGEQNTHYDGSNIQVLEGLEAVRKRPGMYIGSTSSKGLHHLVWEIVDNSVDEHLAGFCNNIDVTIHSDNSVTVVDNGRGIPVDNHPTYKIPTVEVVLTILHAGGKFGGGGYKVSGGLHGVGSSVVNALSKDMTVTVKRNGELNEIKFQKGKTVQSLKVVGNLESETETGTIVNFVPDNEIFKETTEYNFNTICNRMRESSFLNPGLTITVTDEREIDDETETFVKETFYASGGLADYVQYINQSKKTLHDEILYISEEVNGIQVDVAMQYTDTYSKEGIFSYVNNVVTPGGGSHVDGFRLALFQSIKEYIQMNDLIKGEELPTGEDMRVGLTAVISVKVTDPEFEGQTKDKLGNSEVKPAVNAIVEKHLSKFLAEKPGEANIIVQKIIDSFEERMAARKARQERRAKKEQGNHGNLAFPDKLAEMAKGTPRHEGELYLVEGDSAGGSAKQGRNKTNQAILPLKGKVLNAEKATSDKIHANEEIIGISVTAGTDIGEYFDYEKRRYDKIIIMTDADNDGKHIQALLLTFFYRYMRELLEKGHIYIAMPPLFGLKVRQGNKDKVVKYVYHERDLESAKAEYPQAKIQRYKGLGEMNPSQLYSTTMDPNERTLIRVTIEDAAAAETMFHMLMGDESHLRKDYIQKYGHKANLDI